MPPAAPQGPAATQPAADAPTHRQIVTILTGLMLGMFLAALDQTIVSTSIRTIADELHGLDMQAWATTAYLITSTIATPLYGKLSDIFGRKPFFIAAISIFVVGSALCSAAWSMYSLAGFRAIQGVGAGGLFSLSLAIIGDLVPPRERARYQGYFLAVFGTSSVLGPVVGGFFAGHATILGLTGWRWVFLVNVPIGLIALLVVSATLKLRTARHSRRIDWWGAAALIVALVPLLTVAEQGREWGWTSGRSLVAFALGSVGTAAFLAIEARMGDDALIPLRIFRERAMALTILASFVVGVAMFGALSMMPLYMQIVHDASPMASGLMMLPLVLGMMLMSLVSGQVVSRTGIIRPLPIIGTLTVAGGCLLFAGIGADTSLHLVMAMMFLTGLGLGLCMQPLMLIVQNAARPTEIGMATSSATFFRQMGGTLGVAVFISLLFGTVGGNIADALQDASAQPEFRQAVAGAAQDPTLAAEDPHAASIVRGLADPAHADGLGSITRDSSVLSRLPESIAHPFQVGFAESMSPVFYTAAGIAALGFVVLLLLPRIELRSGPPQAVTVAAE